MARLWSSGFELKTTTAGVELDSITGSPTIDTTTFRSGAAAFRAHPSATTAYFTKRISNPSTNVFVRFYLYIATAPAATISIMILEDNSDATFGTSLRLSSSLTLQFHSDGNSANVGSASPALNLNQWYRIEVAMTTPSSGTAADYAECRIDGVAFVNTNTARNADIGDIMRSLKLGACTGTSSPDLYFDDVAVNDSSGSFQNTFPGAGQIIHLQPNEAGDNNAFTVQVGGTAGAANNYTRVSEVTPDDVSTYNGDVTATDTDDFNITNTPGSIGASDTINVVSVGVRYRALVAASEAAFKARIKNASGGTVTSSTAITPNSTTWKTNTNAVPNTYPLTLYQDPNSSNWTKSTLDTAQIGYNISTTNTNAADISTIWMLVDSTPFVVPSATSPLLSLLGVGS